MNASNRKNREEIETAAFIKAGQGPVETGTDPMRKCCKEPLDGRMARIESQVRAYADVREKLAVRLKELNARMEAMTREAMPELKEMARRAAERHAQLEAVVKASPQLFIRPRTAVFHGLKVGFRRQEGRLEYEDADEVVERVRRLLPDPDPYLHTVTLPDREALAGLPPEELDRLGCRWVEGADVVVIKPVAGDLDRQIQRLFRESGAAGGMPRPAGTDTREKDGIA